MRVADKIKFMRQLKGFSQEEIANKLEMSVQGYAKIEQARTDVPYSRLKQIASALEIDELELLSFGERNVFYFGFTGDNNHQFGNIYNNQKDEKNEDNILILKTELEKAKILLLEQAKEITNLKEMLNKTYEKETP